MKTLKLLFILSTCSLMASCLNSSKDENKTDTNKYYKTSKDVLNDSTFEVSNWIDSTKAICFLISKKDTLDAYTYTKNGDYFNYAYFTSSGLIYKLKQFVYVDDIILNEIVHIDNKENIVPENSFYITAKNSGDFVLLEVFPKFDKLVVKVGNKGSFNKQNWEENETFTSANNLISLSKKYIGRKLMLNAIMTGKDGRDESGKNFYFDLENLLCRDIKKTLICFH